MIKNLKDIELISKTKDLVRDEKRITLEILNYLQEIEDRRLYAKRGYSSLFEFCMKELGYSESATNRRISAMRLSRSMPEIKSKIEEGSVNLSTLCQLQTFIKREEKLEEKKLSIDEKKELLKAIENKSQKQCEKEFAKISPENVKIRESERPVTESLTEIKFMASKDLMAKFNELRSHLSHKNIDSYRELFEELATMALKKIEIQKARPTQRTSVAEAKRRKPVEASLAPRGSIPTSIKRAVWQRDHGQCQYVDLLTNRKCESRHKLQYDHLWPVALGGITYLANLRLLCATHNQLEAMRHLSKKHMEKFIPSLRGEG